MLALSTHVLLMFVLQNRKPKVESGFKINNVNLDMFVGCLVRVPFLYRRFFQALISQTKNDCAENTAMYKSCSKIENAMHATVSFKKCTTFGPKVHGENSRA
jgi:hypothetical protein